MKKIKLPPEEQQKLKYFYNIITNEVLPDEFIEERVNIVQYLENATRQNFRTTEDFHKKMKYYFLKQDKMRGSELKKLRKKNSWTQKELAEILGISRVYLACMESGVRPLNRGAVDLLHKIHTSPCGTQNSIQTAVENKQVTRVKKGVSDHD